MNGCFFFFSSRRRHTRCLSDWSSDVCSSDLREGVFLAFQYPVAIRGITNAYFLRSAVNAIRKHRGAEELGPVEFMDALEEKLKVIGPSSSAPRCLRIAFTAERKK